ncbi:MAG: substrate-binding domain-containing protein [Bacteroidia bacterium]|nr:substrate-binding domain-containing protein [Bacteroidia bacterium]
MLHKLSISLIVLLMLNCGNAIIQPPLDTETEGTINVAVDESYRPLLEAEFETFAMLFPNAHINVKYVNENEAYKLLSIDSVRLAIGARELTAAELAPLTKRKITAKKTKIASDAIAFICNKNNKDTTLSATQLEQLLTGKAITWNNLNSKTNFNNIVLVFDNAQSSTASYLKQRFLPNATFPKNSYALKNNLEVITYVSKHPNSIGVISTSWISDGDDPTTDSLRKSITVMALQSKDAKEPNEYYQPYQAYLSMDKYLLTRPLYIINRESRHGLGTGFVTFVLGEKGQRIILKSGLLPTKVPERIVGFSNE